MDLSIITVTYQSKEFIGDQILSVVGSVHTLEYEHIIIDNASSDGTADHIKEYYSTYVKFIQNPHNVGFAKANNLGVEYSSGKYLLFLNPDMKIESGTLDALVEWMQKRQDVGIASVKLLSIDGNPHPALRPLQFPKMELYLKSLCRFIPFFCTVHPDLFYQDFDDDTVQEVDHVRGAFMLMRRDVVNRLGFAFDPKYHLLLEDVDICKEISKMGLKVVYNPCVSCVDLFGKSFSKQAWGLKFLHFCKSLKIYSKKWYPWHESLLIRGAVVLGICLRLPTLIANKPLSSKGSIKKMIDLFKK
jgi:GT2 family glycosyltransferase